MQRALAWGCVTYPDFVSLSELPCFVLEKKFSFTNVENKGVSWSCLIFVGYSYESAPQIFPLFHINNFLGGNVKFWFDPELSILSIRCDVLMKSVIW
jgi:hypothetical protein